MSVIAVVHYILQSGRRRPVTSELPAVGVDDIDIQDTEGEIHVFANPTDKLVLHQDDKYTGDVSRRISYIFCIVKS